MLSKIKTLIAGVATANIGSMPTTPDNAVCIYPTGGYSRDLSGSLYREPTFMIKVRNTDYATGYALCDSIQDTLHGKVDSNFLLIAQEGDIQFLGRDSANREEWTLNFRCYYK
jgi:hypothetical protein